ncbi:hypothetical protein [Hyalangium versicolor]|uniref:hypothetical protein n=1 Tax=Hyalangium versicolor TaxID=2861190 RepID=UPI001CCA6A63|nr:hypothetical protein [Hyalangium versicolor]
MPTRRSLLPCLLLAVGLCLSCNTFPQNQGHYDLRFVSKYRDDCNLLPFDKPESLWDGSLLITGQVVRMDFELLEMQLVGRFLESKDRFAVDGSVANASIVLPNTNEECLLDQVSVHLEGTTVCRTRFDGTVRVRYEARQPDQCVCELWASFEAVQNGESCEE